MNNTKKEHISLKGSIQALSISKQKGIKKDNVSEVVFVVDHGIEGDAHAGSGGRQVSLLAIESIDKIIAKGLDVAPGDFAENVTTRGVELYTLPLGSKFILDGRVELLLTQIGKVCHERCAIYYEAGDCVMPREGIFCRVLKGGVVHVEAEMEIILPSNR